MKKLMWTLLTFVLIAVAFLILNGGLIGVQNFFKKDEIAKFEKMKSELEDLQYDIEEQEYELDSIEEHINELELSMDDSKSTIDGYESDYPEGIPEEEYEYYTDAVNAYNTGLEDFESLVSEYDEKHEIYSDSIEAYNMEVKTVNNLSEDIGSTWVIVPIPGGK